MSHRDRGVEAVEHPHVLVVEIDVDVAVEVAVRAEQLLSVSGCAAVSARSTSPTVAPSASTSAAPPVCGRRTGGILTVAMRAET